MNKYLMFFILSAILLSACGPTMTQRQEQHRTTLQSWIGHDANEIIRAWGYPQQINEMPNGNKLFTYINSAQITNPVVTLPQNTTYNVYGNTVYKNQGPAMTIGGDTVTYWCKIIFEINREGKAIYFRSDGNRCY